MANNAYYRFTIASVQAVGPGVDLLGSKDIYDELSDNKEELQKWITSYQNKWPMYGLTVMCDGRN